VSGMEGRDPAKPADTAEPPPADAADPIIGIDLGTTNSLAAYCDERGPRTLGGWGDGVGDIVPSVVRYEADADGRLRAVVGTDARERAVEFPRVTVGSVKRLMGRSVRDAAADVPYLPYEVVAGHRSMAAVAIPTPSGVPRVLTPQEVSADVLRAVRARAEAALGVPVRRAVVTVPAYFDDAQRQATRDAGRLAGLEVVRIVSEPTAAALAYGLGSAQRTWSQPATVAVYDLGGGTFDVSILRITPAQNDDAPAIFQVLATDGDTRLGGDDADHQLVALFLGEMRDQLDLDLPHEDTGGVARALAALPPATRRALAGFAQDVKHRLSEADTASVAIDAGDAGVYERTVTRAQFESLIAPWVRRTIAACERALAAAADKPGGDHVDAVVLVGGSTRIPAVRDAVASFFGLEPYTALDPDRVVALGAAAQAATLGGGARRGLLLDVIPLSLGIETVGGAVAKLIVANTTVPTRARETFSTSVDNQTAIELNVLQGEREMAADCRSLGAFHLRGIPPMPAGVPQVEVQFALDANGVLDVSAVEKRSGAAASLQVIPNHGLTRDEVRRIEADALEHAREDMARHRVVDLLAHARLDMKWINDALERAGGALGDTQRRRLDDAMAQLRAMADKAEQDWSSVDPDAFSRAKQAMDEASLPLHEAAVADALRGMAPDGAGGRGHPGG